MRGYRSWLCWQLCRHEAKAHLRKFDKEARRSGGIFRAGVVQWTLLWGSVLGKRALFISGFGTLLAAVVAATRGYGA